MKNNRAGKGDREREKRGTGKEAGSGEVGDNPSY